MSEEWQERIAQVALYKRANERRATGAIRSWAYKRVKNIKNIQKIRIFRANCSFFASNLLEKRANPSHRSLPYIPPYFHTVFAIFLFVCFLSSLSLFSLPSSLPFSFFPLFFSISLYFLPFFFVNTFLTIGSRTLEGFQSWKEVEIGNLVCRLTPQCDAHRRDWLHVVQYTSRRLTYPCDAHCRDWLSGVMHTPEIDSTVGCTQWSF